MVLNSFCLTVKDNVECFMESASSILMGRQRGVQQGLFNKQYAVCSMQYAVYSVQCAVCSIQCAVCPVQCAS